MQASRINGWRELLARILAGFELQAGVTPEWLVNPDTNRRLKLDYLFPEIGVAVRFVGLQGSGRRRRKSDEEEEDERQREEARAAVCREHGVLLISIDPDGEPRAALRSIEMILARATSQMAVRAVPQREKQRLMPLLSQARRTSGELTTKLISPDRLNLYAEMWSDRQNALVTQATPATISTGPLRSYEPGMQVVHEKFGPGRVTAVQPDGADQVVTVEFVEAGERTFSAFLARDKLLPEE